MPFKITATITCYLLPNDGPVAEQQLLQQLGDPGETYIIAYAFTLVPMIDAIIAASKRGIPFHLYLDSSQVTENDEKPILQNLIDAGVEVTIGTSPEGEEYICHTKGIASNSNPVWCWEGSTNFSEEAWHQVNTAMVFSSPTWYANFVAQFKQLRQYAWSNERDLQLMTAPPSGVTTASTS